MLPGEDQNPDSRAMRLHEGVRQGLGLAGAGARERRAQLDVHRIAPGPGLIGHPHGDKGQEPQALLALQLEEQLNQAVLAGADPART